MCLFSCVVVLVAPPASGARHPEVLSLTSVELRSGGAQLIPRHKEEVLPLSFVSINASAREAGFEDDYEACYDAKIDHASNLMAWQALSTAVDLVALIPGGVGFAITRALAPLLEYKQKMLECEEHIMNEANNNPDYKGTPAYNKLLSECVKVSGLALAGLEGDEAIRTVADILEIVMHHALHEVTEASAEHVAEASGEHILHEVGEAVLSPAIAILAVKSLLGNAAMMSMQFAYEQVQAAAECLNAGALGKAASLLTVLRLTREIQDIIATKLIPSLVDTKADVFRLRAAWEAFEEYRAQKYQLTAKEEKKYPALKKQIEDFADVMTKGDDTQMEAVIAVSEKLRENMDDVRIIMKDDVSTTTELQEEKEHTLRQIEIFKNPITWLRGKIPEAEPEGSHTGSAKERDQALADEHISASDDSRLLAKEHLGDLEGTPVKVDTPMFHFMNLASMEDIFLEFVHTMEQQGLEAKRDHLEINGKLQEAQAAMDQAIALQKHATQKLVGPCDGIQVPECKELSWQMAVEFGGCHKFWYKIAKEGVDDSELPAFQCQSRKLFHKCKAKGALRRLVRCTPP